MKKQTESLEHASVRQYCKAVRVPTIGANFLPLAEQAVKENHSHIRYLEALLAMECEDRDRHAISNRIRDAQLPRMKTLEEFDFAQAPQISAARIRELAEGGYVERSEPIVLIGEAGTGKSHLATGLCVAACRQKRRVRFTTAAALVNELVEAKQNNQVRRLMNIGGWKHQDPQGNLREVKESFYGLVSGDQIQFTYQREDSAPIEFTAKKVVGSTSGSTK